jgi:hypothetical protein
MVENMLNLLINRMLVEAGVRRVFTLSIQSYEYGTLVSR